ncbi:MAG: transposase [Crocinitomicaceae bacterium]|nr:transposase [Crocinitomicaceae bacterium]
MEEKLDFRVPRSFALIIILFLSIKGRINFLQLERFSGKCESRFRYFFERSFDFLSFNKAMLKVHLNGRTALAFDPSYISKAGKKTPGVVYFWSGVAGRAKWGLEFCGLAVLDLTRKTAFHLFGFQTIDLRDEETLIEFYVRKLLVRKESLLEYSIWIMQDWFLKKKMKKSIQ